MTFAIIDTETTGGNPAKDRIMEIAIIIHNGERVIEQFSTLINPETKIAPFIVALTGISDDMVKDAPTFQEVAPKILEMTEGRVFVAHNVRFDYGILRNEFRRLKTRFQRKQLCTVKLSREILPGYDSYSLGKLCKQINIPIDGRHRAYGDAEATAQLFEKLVFNDRRELIRSMLEEEVERSALPKHLDPAIVDDLPEETGVYYFLDAHGKPLYIGKSKNIRQRVMSHFMQDLEKPRYRELKEKIYDISYELTGSELVAMLMESAEIRHFMPPFNTAQKIRKYRFGLYVQKQEEGYLQLKVENIHPDQKPILQFTHRESAIAMLNRLVPKFGLYPSLCEIATPNGLPNMHAEKYNALVKSMILHYQYKNGNFFIIGEGRSHVEQSVVWVENHFFRGFGYFEPEFIENDIEDLKAAVKPLPDHQDFHRIIRMWLNRKNKDTYISY